MDTNAKLANAQLIGEYESLQADFEHANPPESCELGSTMKRFGILMCRGQIIQLKNPQPTSLPDLACVLMRQSPWAAAACFGMYVYAKAQGVF